MQILVTGAEGQLGKDIIHTMSGHHQVVGYGRLELDATNLQHCRDAVSRIQPDVIIHAAAYTAVDLAESHPEDAYRVNAYGTRNVAMAAQEAGAKMLFISTDYVFDGKGSSPYHEYDDTNPASIYGKSKRAGEMFTQTLSTRHFIVRTSWLYGSHGHNFVKTMLNLSNGRERVTVVRDQIGSPTYTVDLCRFLEELIQTENYGIYHATNSGQCSWYEFAKAIFEICGIDVRLEPCTTNDFPRPAPRPTYSVLDHMAIRANAFTDLRPWQEALRYFLQEEMNV